MAIPSLAVAALLATLPGLGAALALRLRGAALMAGSVGASFAVIGLASIVAPIFGLSWGIWPVVMTAVAVAVLAGLLRLLAPRAKPPAVPLRESLRAVIPLCVTTIIGFLLIARTLITGIGSIDAISQNYDTMFHLNAVAFILDTANASPFAMTMVSQAETTFYPTTWHATVALLASLTSVSIPVATNLLAVVVSALVWPISVGFFTFLFVKNRTSTAVIVGVIAASFGTFPYLFLVWGLLYPNLLSTALVPIALGFFYMAIRNRQYRNSADTFTAWIAGVGVLGAATLAHPNALYATILIFTPVLIVVVAESFRLKDTTLVKSAKLSGVILFFVVSALLWQIAETSDNLRNFRHSVFSAVSSTIASSPLVGTNVWFVGLLLMAGAVVLLMHKKHRWLTVSYALVALFTMIPLATTNPIRGLFTEPWYNDAHRLAALLAVVGVPLAAVAVDFALDQFAAKGKGELKFWRYPVSARSIAATVLSLAVLAVFLGQTSQHVRERLGHNFRLDDQSDFLTPDELELLERLPQSAGADAVILSDPWNGSGFAYSVSNTDVIFPHLKGGFDPRAVELGVSFGDDLHRTCLLLDELGATHVIGSDHPNYMNREEESFRALTHIDDSPILSETDRVGAATLYTITGCEREVSNGS